ncbi:MAG: hypothetical protein DMG22_06920 [Acidobacteria bacterium]|nr:MAG: hypothetical protein DMG22_06920 [Acidobacteriota bacterium]
MANIESTILQNKFMPIDKTSLSEEIAGQIMSLVSSGDLMPGQKLPSERELCLRFGVGRSSLREALRCLTIVGVLETRVGEGTFLAMNRDKFIGKVLEWRVATERKNVENLMKVRLALETETASNAAKVSASPGASEIAYNEHVLILNAIRARDPESAKALMRDHIGKALKRYVEVNSSAGTSK